MAALHFKYIVAYLLCSFALTDSFIAPQKIGYSVLRKRTNEVVLLRESSSPSNDENDSGTTSTTTRTTTTPEEESTREKSENNAEKEIILDSSSAPRQPGSAENMSSAQIMAALGTSPRRIFLSFASATGIALAGNLFGVTSGLLQTVPETVVESSGLDTYFPRGNFKRYRANGYTFVYPKQWLGDPAILLAKTQQRTVPLEYSMSRPRKGSGVLPDAAFGPPGKLNERGISDGDTNVSTIVTPGLSGFSLLGTLGSPQSAAETLLKVSLAPEGSGRVATLLGARDEMRPGGLVYEFEYCVDRGSRGVPLRAISIIAGAKRGDTLFTMTVVAPEKDWANKEYAASLRKVAESFHLTTQ